MKEDVRDEFQKRDDVAYAISHLFQSPMYDETEEQERICPFCNDWELGSSHFDIAAHIIEKHPERLQKYSSSLDYMLKDPITYMSVSNVLMSSYGFRMGEGDYERNERTCVICGNVQDNRLKLRSHMEGAHKEHLEWVYDMIREMGK